MKEEEALFEQLESYTLGTMTSDERLAFEIKLSSDAELRKQLLVHQEVFELVVDASVVDLKNKLKSGHYQKSDFGKFWLLFIVSLLVGGLIVYTLTTPWRESSTEKARTPIVTKEGDMTPKDLKMKEMGIEVKVNGSRRPIPGPEVPVAKKPNDPMVLLPLNESVEEKKVSHPMGIHSPNLPITKEVQIAASPRLKQKDTESENQGEIQNDNRRISPTSSNDYMFQPSLGESWTIPMEGNEKGEIRLFDSQGQLIFEAQVGQGGINEWNGTNRNGGLVPAGNYLYILTFESNKVLQGYVTVVR